MERRSDAHSSARDLLNYHTDVTPAGIGTTNEFSRTAFYGLLQQSFGANHVWLAFGLASEGSCQVTGPGFEDICTTRGLGAQYYTLGLMHDFTDSAAIYALGYGLFNDVSARYTPFPLLGARPKTNSPFEPLPNIGDISAGSDVIGIGFGFVYSFSVKLMGGVEPPAAAAAKAPEGNAAPPAEEEPAPAAATPPPAREAIEDAPAEEVDADDEVE